MKRVAGGDGDAFAELVKRYTRMLYNVAYRYDANSAEDLVQETFLRAYQHADTFSGRSKGSSWLYRICVNVCLTAQGKSGAPMADIDENNERELEAESEELPEKAGERGEASKALEDGLHSRPGQQRTVFSLRELP